MTADVKALLASAWAALDGTLTLPAGRHTRTAALLGRVALEHLVAADCVQLGLTTRTTMRTSLICVRVLLDAERGRTASLAWAGLSSACHHHAYELAPTTNEIAHLLDMVSGLQRRQ